MPETGGWQVRAAVTEDGCLYAIRQCLGWSLMGRFTEDGLTSDRGVFRRLEPGDWAALKSRERSEEVIRFFFRRHAYFEPEDPGPPPERCRGSTEPPP